MPDNSEIMGCIGRNRYDETYFTFRFCLENRRSGERLPVRLERDGRQIELTLEFGAAPEPGYPFDIASQHADAPPTVITADIPILPDECGGPAVGVDGGVVGVIISRFGNSGSFIIPGDRVASRLAHLRSGKPLSKYPTPAAKPLAPASGAQLERRIVDPARPAQTDIGSRNVADPHAIEMQLKSVANKVTPCAVAVGRGPARGLGAHCFR